MKKLLLILPALLLLGVSCSSKQIGNRGFNSDLVTAKQKCQETADKWDEIKWNNERMMVIRSHFNSDLNACLVEVAFNSSSAHRKIVDIFDDDKELLSVQFSDPSKSLGPWIFQNGIEVKTPDENVNEEYFKRADVLFEVQLPD